MLAHVNSKCYCINLCNSKAEESFYSPENNVGKREFCYMTGESEPQSKPVSHPVIQQISWITGIFGFIASLATAVGAVTSFLTMALLAIISGIAMSLIFTSLVSSYWLSREQSLKTLLYEIRKQSSKLKTQAFGAVVFSSKTQKTVMQIVEIIAKHLALLKHAYRLALFEGNKEIAEDISKEIEQIRAQYGRLLDDMEKPIK